MKKGRHLPAEREYEGLSKQREEYVHSHGSVKTLGVFRPVRTARKCKYNRQISKACLLGPLLYAFCIQLNKRMLNKYFF